MPLQFLLTKNCSLTFIIYDMESLFFLYVLYTFMHKYSIL